VDPRKPEIDAEFVRRVAALARIEVPPAELPGLHRQFLKILDLVSKVQGLDVPSLDPAAQEPVGLEDLREDAPGEVLARREVTGNAPAHDGAFFVVPRFLEE
jgi:aspartyl-tRNA(Asn)/glutamyl-tRNA(Gln) amidotransferase subunit C